MARTPPPNQIGGATDPLFPRRASGWLLVACGVVFPAVVGALWLSKGAPRTLDDWLTPIFLCLLGAALVTFGVCELTGTMSRFRWRAARAQVAKLSAPDVVRWRHNRGYILLALCCVTMVAPLSLVLPVLSPGWFLSTAALIASLYFFALSTWNIREIRRIGDALAYSSKPFRHPSDRVHCSGAPSLQLHVTLNKAENDIALAARDPSGTVTYLADVGTMELALVLAEAVALLLPSVQEVDAHHEAQRDAASSDQA